MIPYDYETNMGDLQCDDCGEWFDVHDLKTPADRVCRLCPDCLEDFYDRQTEALLERLNEEEL